MINVGNFNKKIKIFELGSGKDDEGFPIDEKVIILSTYASVKTTRGYTLIANGSDFEKAYTNFTIRFPKCVINRKMMLEYNNKEYSIEYLNNINEENVLLEIQAKEVMK